MRRKEEEMDIASIQGLSSINHLIKENNVTKTNRNDTFDKLFQSALSMVKQSNDLTNAAEQAEISYALGLTDSTHDLQVAQEKANISLQYTVAVRNKVLEAYKEIMNLQF